MPSLTFIYPEMLWLLLLLGLIWLVAWVTSRRLAPWRFWTSLGLRTAIALALILAVAGAQWVQPVQHTTTVFLLDGSDSLPAAARAQAEGFIQEALRQMPEGDQAAIIVFGDNALVERAPNNEQRLGRISSVPVANRTNLEQALQLGLALFPADTQKRLVLLSDGGENEGHAMESVRLAAARGVPVDVVALALATGDAEALVASVQAPVYAREGQAATLLSTVESSVAQQALVRLIGDGGVLQEKVVALEAGVTQVPFQVELSGSGFQRFRVQIEPEIDGRLQNNEAATLINVAGPPRVLLIAATRADAQPLAAALAATNVNTELLAPEALPTTPLALTSYDAVVLVNTPARALPVGAMSALETYVRDFGKGLVMVGGRDSYGLGGYGRTPVEAALPVEMDVRNREQRPDLALIFVIDKSGSMDACHCNAPDVSSDAFTTRKLDIAKEAVAQAAAVLHPQDTLGIVTFDSRAFQTMPPANGMTVEQVLQALNNVAPEGETNIHAGLVEAEALLNQVDARIKHVILLTDGWGGGNDQSAVAERMRNAGITLSVVAAGGGSADELERLAATGGGRYYASEDMSDVPQIFVDETMTTLGNYIIERPFFPVAVGMHPLLTGISELPMLYGYNGATTKATAREVLRSDDGEPILAVWQYGLGHSAAWLSDTRGQWARNWLTWEEFPRFAGQLLDAVLPQPDDETIMPEVLVAGSEVTLRLNTSSSEDEAQTDRLQNLSLTAKVINMAGEVVVQGETLAQVGPTNYLSRFASPPPGSYLVQVQGRYGDGTPLLLTLGMVVPYSAEYRGNTANPALLSELAALTGGQELRDPAAAFAPTLLSVTQAQELGLTLTLLAFCLLPFDIALRRLLLHRSDFGALERLRRTQKAPPAPTPADATLSRLQAAKDRVGTRISSVTTTPPAAPPPATQAEDPLERLRLAKQRARRRAAGEVEEQ
ncbi:MAG: VWA domain-containing protein [Candidatus Viridilinea halotolerans]|uniref:VWA domain-containing protein n=1 Tax=Candidatus Viridilinea halotolerans TaxID=2491704 RepID=A0A426TWY7_9CHLR|nr:MAG: VWA domain-containing protein [Candidatus Viridilinea halotolerans]